MRILDLFSGIGGFSLGLERAGMETVAFCEFDKKAQLVLKKHWPKIPIYDDVGELNGEKLKHLYPIDLICGGFPCQPFSVAGKRKGKEDDRHLWPEYFRLIQEIRPRWVIGENVSGLINMGLDQVLSDLESASYSCQTLVIPACAVNAPHRRDRVWIIAHAESCDDRKQDGQADTRGKDECGRETEVWLKPGGSCEALAHTSGKGLQGNERIRSNEGQDRVRAKGADGTTPKCGNDGTGGGWWATEPSVGRVAHGVPKRVDRLKQLGNAVVPQIVEQIGRAIMEIENG